MRGASLAVVTLAGVVAIEQFGFANRRWGAGVSGSPVEQPRLFGVEHRLRRRVPRARRQAPEPGARLRVPRRRDRAVPARRPDLRRSVLGQQMLAVRANERAAAAAGINVARVKIIAYAISSFIAGTAGWMYAYNFGSVSAARFGILIALGIRRLRLHRRDHDGLGRGDRRPRRDRGARSRTSSRSCSASPATGRCSSAALLLIVTLIQNPEGVAGTTYRKRQAAKRAKAAAGSGQRARRRAAPADGDGTGDRSTEVNHDAACCRPAASRSRSAACTPWSTSTSTSSRASWSG